MPTLNLLLMLMTAGCQASLSPFFSTENSSNTDGTSVPLEPLTQLRLGDRGYVSSVLTNLFVPPATDVPGPQQAERQELVDKINAVVTAQYSTFGRGCDFFVSSTESCTGTGAGVGLYNESNLVVPPFSLASPLRSALSMRAVYGLLWFRTNDMALRQAIAHVRTLVEGSPVIWSSVAPQVLQLPTQQEIEAAFRLVYRGVEPSANSLVQLNNLVAESYAQLGSVNYPGAQSNGRVRDVWRFLFIALLSSSVWEMP